MKKAFISFFVIYLFSASCFSQFSKTHYIPPISSADAVQVGEQFLYISTPSLTAIDFTINEIGGNIISGTVSRDTPYVFDISANNANQFVVEQSSASTILNNRGYIIEASDLIYVTARVIDLSGNQAGQITSKGLAALGTQFRIGGFLNVLIPGYADRHYTFASILATENNTTISFSDIKAGASLVNNAGVGNTPTSIVLNAGESYVIAVQGPNPDANRDALIGALITSDKPIAVNSGSFGGTNGEMGNLDIGFDQIVSAERTGKDYIFIKSTGLPNVERILLIAHEDNTNIYLGANVAPNTANYTLNHGEYIALLGTDYDASGNLFVHSDKNIFAYQSVGDDSRVDQANQEVFFVPPLSCQTPKEINNIPLIEKIGTRNFTGRVTIVTKAGSPLNFIINTFPFTLATLPIGITVNGPISATGNSNYECYTITGLTGNISVISTTELYLAAYGSNGAATFGGFYSGFTFRPDIIQQVAVSQSSCLPYVELNVSSLTGFDVFQWYFNGGQIPGANSSSYTPSLISTGGYGPGYYKVKATLTACSLDLFSDEIPVSVCPSNIDNDLANDNIDLDNDNDGLSNCLESYGNQDIDISNLNLGNLTVGNYSNSYTGVVTTSTTASAVPFIGNSDGSFISDVPAGKTNWVNYELTFAQPVSLGIEYITTANPTDLLNSNAQYIVNSSINNTITVLNPNDQLLIDTNYDGLYESGVTQFSSFEIRFQLNSISLAAGTGTFKFLTNLSNSISFKHNNLSDAIANKVSLKIFASCLPKDVDNDGVIDQLDLDSDNDGILDNTEFMSQIYIPPSNVDANNNGLDDAYEVTIIASDTDLDGVPDYYDLDSDNDGIFDLEESGSNAPDINNNGVIDGIPTTFGINGLANSIETASNSGLLNYTVVNTDGLTFANYADNDSDDDGCLDVIEAGFTDANNDNQLGNSTPIVNTNGIVINATSGYTTPNTNYIISAPITITTQPIDFTTCELQNATFSVVSNPVNTYQWELSIDGGTTWTTIVNNTTYSGVTTSSLTVSTVSPAMSGYKYRVFLNKNGNSCGLKSDVVTLTTYALPVITTPITLIQCDDDTDAISNFNLTEKNSFISSNFANQTFTYFTTQVGANTNNLTVKINNPTVYSSGNSTVWVRVENNSNGCFRVAQLNLIVSVTQINAATFHRNFILCDDAVPLVSTDIDGTAEFDFSSATSDIQAILPPPSSDYVIKYYVSEADALAEVSPITNISNYRNTTLNQQEIYVRVDSNLDNACFGFGPFVTLKVEALPIANSTNSTIIIRHCDDDQDGVYGFNTSSLESTILNGQTNKTVTYYDALGNLLSSPLPNPFNVNTSQTITVRVTNNVTQASNGPCYDETKIEFIVDDLPQVFPIATTLTTVCDDEIDPLDQNGLFPFNTTTFETSILGTQTGMDISYTLQNGTVLNHLPSVFNSGTQNILVTVTNPLNTTCPATLIIPLIVNVTPKIDLAGNELVCTNYPTFLITLNAQLLDGSSTNNYTYQWYFNNNLIVGETNYSLQVNTEGTYSVDVTNNSSCIKTRIIEVVSSEIATLQEIQIIDLTDSNSIHIIVTGQGDYVYNLDDGVYQESNLFTNVPMGTHTVYIKDINGCGVVQQEINVLGVPKYFTPNGDGINDYWNVKGASLYPNSVITVFDRYGKLITRFTALDKGWDGTYNGTQQLSDDYWYSIKFNDTRSAKGHFTLKR